MKRMIKMAASVILCLSLLTAHVCVAGSASEFFEKAELLRIDSHLESVAGLNEYATVQGACTDGEYAYFVFMQGGVSHVVKYDVRTWDYVTDEKIVNMGHSNDMAYNADKDYIVVANNAPYYNVVTLLNRDTLAPIKDVEIDEDIYAIAYSNKHKLYVVGLSGGYDFALLDSDFKVKKKFEGVKTGYTRQGCDCDDNYIYFVQSGGGKNVLVIYDYAGDHVATVPIESADESENIFHVGNAFYVSMFYYGSKLNRIGFSEATKIAYTVRYDANGGEGEMPGTRVHYGEVTPLRANAFTREGYFFGGWKAMRTSDNRYIGYRNGSGELEWLDEADVFEYALYDDEENVAETVMYGDVSLSAVWIAEQYGIRLNSGEGEGEAMNYTVAHDEAFTIPDCGYNKEGYVFDGFAASRETDGRVYGYRAGSEKAEWLNPGDAARVHHFRTGDAVSAMTREGNVNLTAQYKFAYTFGEDGSTLVEYVGVDEKVMIPGNDGELKTLAEGAIKDNKVIKDLYIPSGVDSLHKQAVSNCPQLKSIYFEGKLPRQIDGDCIVSDVAPVLYEIHHGQAFCVGFFTGSAGVPLLRYHESALSKLLGEQEPTPIKV